MSIREWDSLTTNQRELPVRRLMARFGRIVAEVESIEQLAEVEPEQANREQLAKRAVSLIVEGEALAAAVVRLGWRERGADEALDRARLTVRLIRNGGARTQRRRRRGD